MVAKKKRKIPTKAELLQLQKLYKTDEKIAERLGGIPAYLVAYWRRKKNIPKHSQPKFSEKEIRDLWERFGDDDKCGMELGISKAAFYNWRRRYGIKEKPAFLKLEQLEFNFPGLKLNAAANSLYNKLTLTQKIIGQLSEADKIDVGDTVELEPSASLFNMNVLPILEKFKQSNTDLVWNPNKIFISLEKNSLNSNSSYNDRKKEIFDFIKRQGIKQFYHDTDGYSMQVFLENGQILPGNLIVSPLKYVSTLGALANLSVSCDESNCASLWSSGKISLTVPETIHIQVSGRRSRGIYGKDIALSILNQLQQIDVTNKAIEFTGNVISQMNISERMTLCNVSADSKAMASLCPFDSVTRRFLTGRALGSFQPLLADKNAEYKEMYQVNVDQLAPQIYYPFENEIKPVVEYENHPIKTAIIGTMGNGRFDDLRVTAEILKGKQLAPESRLYIIPGTKAVYLEALKKGIIRVLVESGATIIFPGQSPFGKDNPPAAHGEKILLTSNIGYIEKIGCALEDCYLCSPATAAASLLNGSISDPTRFVK